MIERLGPRVYGGEEEILEQREKLNEMIDELNKIVEQLETPIMYYSTDGTPVPKPSPKDEADD